jgi:hypothetical protein
MRSARSGYDVVGRDGRTLRAKRADGFRSLHGYTTHALPNVFIVETRTRP